MKNGNLNMNWLAAKCNSHRKNHSTQNKTHKDFTSGIETRPGITLML